MKKSRFLAVVLILQLVMSILQMTTFAAAPTPELFAYRIMSRSTVLKADDPIAYAFNERHDLSAAMPYFEGDTAMVPVRFMAESFTAECAWESARGGTFVVENRSCIVIRIQAGKAMTADGVILQSDVLPTLKNGTLFVPAAVFADAMKIVYKEDRETGLLFFSRESEEERHAKVDYARDILPYFDEAYRTNEKTYLYVATDGSDETGDGSLENPYATIDRAKLAVRELSANQKGDITVYVRGGLYQISEPIRFAPEDSGKNGYKITYTAYEDEKVIIEGAKTVSGWKLYNGNIYVADFQSEEPVHLLYENGTMVIKARHPNRDVTEPRAGFLQTLGSSDAWYGLSWAEGEIPYVENTKDLELYVWPGGAGGYWMWFSQISPLAEYNQKTRTMKMGVKARYELGAGSRYYMMGALEFLDTEGEFYHDSAAGKLYYIPYGYGMAGKTVTVPITDSLVSFEGTSQTETVRNIAISKLELRNTKRNEQVTYYVGAQQLEATGNAVDFSFAENCSVRDCYIHDVGGNGVLAKNFFANLKVSGNRINNLGLGGITFHEDSVFRASNNVASNNWVYLPAQVLGQSAGIKLTGGGDNFAVHNRIYNVTRSAVTFGSGHAGHVYVGYNDCEDCNTAAEDTGVIYSNNQTYNLDKGTEAIGSSIYNNFVHDSNAGFGGWFGIYSDDISHNVRTQNNIITRMQMDGEDELGTYGAGIFGKGINYKMINNVVANAGVAPSHGSLLLMYSNGPVTSEGWVLERNITYNHSPKTYYAQVGNWSDRTIASADNNIFYDDSGEAYTVAGTVSSKTLEAWQQMDNARYDQHSLTEDPKFMNEAADDFRLRYDSPGRTLGIQSINQSAIGLSEDFMYADPSDEISRLFINREGYPDTLSAINLRSGEGSALKVKARTKNGFAKTPETVSFTSDAPHVAQVDASGTVTGISSGKAKITATVQDGSSTASIDLYVFVDDEILDFKFDEETYFGEAGGTDIARPLAGTTRFGQILTIDDLDNLQFTSANTEAATIDGGGNIKFIKPGSGSVSVTAEFNGQIVSATSQLECVEHIVYGIKLQQSAKAIKAGSDVNIKLVGLGTGGKEVPLTGFACNLTSLDEDIVSVGSQNGADFVLQAKSAGKASMKASVSWYGKTFEATSALTVTADNSLINGWKLANYTNSTGFAIEDENGISIYSTGADIYRAEDDFTFVYKEESAADLTVEATIQNVDSPQTNFSSTGVMLRQENTAGSFNVNLRYLPNSKGCILTWRNAKFPSSKDISVRNVLTDFTYSDPVKIRLQKKGNVIIASCMDQDGNWHDVQEIELALSGNYLAGVTSFSGNNEMWFESRVDDVKIYEGVE